MGIFRQFPYTNFHELNLDWIVNKVKEMEENLISKGIIVPKAGNEGQVLAKKSQEDYDLEWINPTPITTANDIIIGDENGEPERLAVGSEGQVLTVGDEGIEWATKHEMPQGGTTGQVLAKSSNTDYATEWKTIIGLPPNGTQGYFATATGNPDTPVTWSIAEQNFINLGAGQIVSGSTYQLTEEQATKFNINSWGTIIFVTPDNSYTGIFTFTEMLSGRKVQQIHVENNQLIIKQGVYSSANMQITFSTYTLNLT